MSTEKPGKRFFSNTDIIDFALIGVSALCSGMAIYGALTGAPMVINWMFLGTGIGAILIVTPSAFRKS